MSGRWLWRGWLVAAVLAMAIATGGCAAQSTTYARPREVVIHDRTDIGMFYEALAPHGHWFEYKDYGWVWTPYNTDFGWRPYRDGRWAYSDCGWTWVADEEWGWAPYHYGRWFFDEEYGWVWVPGTEWAPAWVAWRYDDHFVGWAPLPPGARWDSGLRYAAEDCDRDLPAHMWCFVDREHLVDVRLRERYVPVERNVTIYNTTKVQLVYDNRGNRPFNRGVDVDKFERDVHMPVQRIRIEDGAAPGRESMNGGSMRVFRPALAPAPAQSRPPVPTASTPPAEVAAKDVDRQARQAADERKLQSFYDQRRQQLEAQHRQELAHPPAGRAPEMLQQQHEGEIKALEQQRERDRHVLQGRMQKGIAPAKPAKPAKKTKPAKDERVKER